MRCICKGDAVVDKTGPSSFRLVTKQYGQTTVTDFTAGTTAESDLWLDALESVIGALR